MRLKTTGRHNKVLSIEFLQLQKEKNYHMRNVKISVTVSLVMVSQVLLFHCEAVLVLFLKLARFLSVPQSKILTVCVSGFLEPSSYVATFGAFDHKESKIYTFKVHQ